MIRAGPERPAFWDKSAIVGPRLGPALFSKAQPMTGDDCEYQADPQVEAVLDQHFSTKRFCATDVVAHFADPGMFDRIVYVLSNRMGQDGIPFYLHTTDEESEREGWPCFIPVTIASIAEIEDYAD